MTSSSKPFLHKLHAARKTSSGLYLFEQYLSSSECKDALSIFDSDAFPWDLKPRLYGERLQQHAYLYQRPTSSNKAKRKWAKSVGLQKLEELCLRIESDFDGEVTDVYCNRFQDSKHNIDWHKDTYGEHIFVLSLGSQRTVKFRNDKTRKIEKLTPNQGDMYLMPLKLNSTHTHKVCSAEEMGCDDSGGTRLSFVFFFDSPKYADEAGFKISKMDRFIGKVEDVLSKVLI